MENAVLVPVKTKCQPSGRFLTPRKRGVDVNESTGNKADEGAAAGAVTGGALGGLGGLLVGLGALAIPGIMSVYNAT